MTEREIAKGVARGDAEAVRIFVDSYYEAAYRMLRRLTGHTQEAEDLTQESFIEARRTIHCFRGEATLKTWFLRVAYRRYCKWLPNQPTRPIPNIQPTQSPFNEVDARVMLEAALSQISPVLREAFILHALDELPINDVARILGVPKGTVQARVFRARRSLVALLEMEEPNYACK